MSYRSRSHPLSPGLVDVETARRAVAQVARERDALARQLQRSQGLTASLQRQLEARNEENADLARALRALEARAPAGVDELAEEKQRVEQAEYELRQLRTQLDERRQQLTQRTQQRDEALAERDRLKAALRAARAETGELLDCPPDGERAQRLAADLANLRRHQSEAIERGVRAQTDRLLLEISSVRDSVQRALDSLPGASSAWHDGLLAVLARIDGVFDREGVHRVGAPGERFEPRAHEAVGTTAGPEGFVVETVSSGLARADGRMIAPAQVLVGGSAA